MRVGATKWWWRRKLRWMITRTNRPNGMSTAAQNQIFTTVAPGASLYRTIIADGVEIASDEHFENAAIVRADMVRSCKEIPEKALKGYIQGENYIVPLN